ncbi:MAG: NUDIX domain-containing protein [bacterium]|nr:NUDIX domain-containing protein [bacterium]
MENKDTYFVAIKVFLLNSEGSFLITKDRFGDWDIPGGRLREQDFNVSLERVVGRKMKEEVGEDVKYDLGGPVVFMRHERNEILPSGNREKRRIFAVGYTAQYREGEIRLGKNHERYEWVPVKTFDPKTRFTGGWLQGVKDFQDGYEKFLRSEKQT